MIKAKRVGHASFITPDIDKQVDYYREVVGLHLVDREKNRAFLATNSGQLAVVLEHGGQQNCARLSFEVSPTLSFADMARKLADMGLKSETRQDDVPGLSSVLAFSDSKGTTIELFSEPRFVSKGPSLGGAVAIKLGHLAFAVRGSESNRDFLRTSARLPRLRLDR